ncbi:MAG: CBS domain-containing protein [Planctomycetota bacterium]|nr:CBS domain-containing protein [Planctomycetota bacterium]
MSTKVGDVTLKSVPIIKPTDTLAHTTSEMRQYRHGCALVCVEGKLHAIITERDILKYLSKHSDLEIPIQQIMTAQPRTVKEDDTLFSAVRLMDEGGYRRLPVINPNNEPLGIVDVKTVTHFLVEHFPSAVYNQAAQTQLIPQRREGA